MAIQRINFTMNDNMLLRMPNGKLSAKKLDEEHYSAFVKAITNVLSLEISLQTIAQLFDGLPLLSVLWESIGVVNHDDAPINRHTELCDGALERAQAFISSFDPARLKFDPRVSYAFNIFRCINELMCQSY